MPKLTMVSCYVAGRSRTVFTMLTPDSDGRFRITWEQTRALFRDLSPYLRRGATVTIG